MTHQANWAGACDVIITMVGYPKDVEEIYLGEDGLVANAKPGSYLIDMTTSSPLLVARIFEAAGSQRTACTGRACIGR